MQVFKTKPVYKAKDPYTTINQVRNTLYDCNIFLKETAFHQDASDTDAAELRFADRCFKDLRIATNGKGMNPRYAMASAYGEMMERLQCGFLLVKHKAYAYEQGDIKFKWGPDEKILPADQAFIDNRDIIVNFFEISDETFEEAVAKLKGIDTLCVPFYNYFDKKVQYVPYDIMSSLAGSNGLCAGNTAREAIAQGMSELYERQSLNLIFRDNKVLPKLSKDMFDSTAVKEKLEGLESRGYEVDILDASMGLDYPVIGLRVITDYGLMFNLGADANPIVALERCLTEMYQLTDEKTLELRACKESSGTRAACRNFIEEDFYHHQLSRSKHVGSGDKPDNVFNLEDVYTEDYRYNSDLTDDFDYMVELTSKLGYHLYIRDCSYLGFPAYAVLIPEIATGDYFISKYFEYIIKSMIEPVSLDEPTAYPEMLEILLNLQEKYIANTPSQELGDLLK